MAGATQQSFTQRTRTWWRILKIFLVFFFIWCCFFPSFLLHYGHLAVIRCRLASLGASAAHHQTAATDATAAAVPV